MLPLVGFFLLTLAVMFGLRHVPFLGALFNVPLLGFFLAAILVSAVCAWFGARAVERRRFRRNASQLGAVETPHNQGKLGSLLLAAGRVREAAPCLERAVAGEPDSLEWRYRHGLALLRSGRAAEAARALEPVAARNEEYAYGEMLLRLAEAQQAAGEPARALESLERHERSQGETPEALYRRGLALRALGRGAEARAALARVSAISQKRAHYQRRADAKWVLLAWLRRVA